MECIKCKKEIPDGAPYCCWCGKKQQTKKATKRGNGTGSVYRRNDKWVAEITKGYREENGSVKRVVAGSGCGCRTKKEALDYLPMLAGQKKREKAITWRELYEMWIPTHRAGKSTIDCYKSAEKYFYQVEFWKLEDIEIDDLQECMDECPRGRRTKENMKALAGLMYKYAVPRGYAELNLGQYLIVSGEFEKSNQAMRKAMFRAQMIAGIMQPLTSFVSYFAYAAVCVVGGILLSNGKITFGTITAFLVYVNLFQSPMSQMAQAMNSVQMAGGAAARVNKFLAEDELSDETSKPRKLLTGKNATIRGEVEFDHVHFGYDEDKIIIPDFSAKVKPGMKVAIVGPTGAGKTTMVNLLMRFYELNGGDILIDGVSIKDISRAELHDIFGMVLQDTWMFAGTLRENILFSKTGVSDDELMKICREAGLEHFVNTLPEGLDTYMDGEGSVSGGQKQLITIARAMAEKAPLLILDEATSNVDTRTEEVIQEAMDRLTQGRTSFVIAHRLSTVMNSDVIMVLDHGRIIERGNHEKLIAEKGTYYQLYTGAFELE